MNMFLFYLISMGGGIAIVYYTKQVYDIVGDWAWCTRFFGRTGTYTFLKLLGAFMIFFPVLVSFGAFDGIVNALSSIGL